MAQHVKILGILHIVYAGLVVLIGIIVLVVMGGIAGIVGASDHSEDAATAIPVLGAIGAFVFILLLILSLPGLIGGFGLMQFKPWARILVIILSVFELLSVPFGTALGIYGLWVLLNTEAERLFQGPPAMPVGPRV
ncbi:MAG: hypothetical protein ABSB86_19310 [Bryobacteraceae bacterium]|jgi:hypothetical protein